jgi:hypothetical protein
MTVLRKCKILATRLDSNEFAQWVEWELNGYPSSQPIPDYRRLIITYYASFLSVGWRVKKAAIPLHIVPEEHWESFKYIEFRDGIAKADSLARGRGLIAIERPELALVVNGKMYPEMECQNVWSEMSQIEFQQLLSAVRNRILDFSLKVEAENPDAGEAPVNSRPVPMEKLQTLVHNTFYGSVGAVAQNSSHFSQIVDMVVSTQDLARFVAEFETHIDELRLDERQKQRAEAQITTLKAELAGDPDPLIVKQAGRTLRNITEGAIGSLLATAAQPAVWRWIHQMLSALSN